MLLIHRDLPLHGGVTRSFLTLARYINRNKVELHVASLEHDIPPDALAAFRELDVPVNGVGKGLWPQTSRLHAIISNSKAQVLCCTSFRSYALAKMATRGRHLPIIFWLPGIALMTSWWKRWLFRRWARKDTLLSISEAVRKAHEYQAHQGRSIVSYYGVEPAPALVDSPTDRDRARAILGLGAGERAIGYIAEFASYKDHDVLIKAFATLKPDALGLKLFLFGRGSAEKRIRRLATSLSNHIYFPGIRPDVRLVLPAFDVYAHPCAVEGFGRAVAEAMAAGLPVVAANAGALPELVEDGKSGLLFQPGDSNSLCQAVLRLLDNPSLCKHLASNAQERAQQLFSPERYAKEFADVIISECRTAALG